MCVSAIRWKLWLCNHITSMPISPFAVCALLTTMMCDSPGFHWALSTTCNWEFSFCDWLDLSIRLTIPNPRWPFPEMRYWCHGSSCHFYYPFVSRVVTSSASQPVQSALSECPAAHSKSSASVSMAVQLSIWTLRPLLTGVRPLRRPPPPMPFPSSQKPREITKDDGLRIRSG